MLYAHIHDQALRQRKRDRAQERTARSRTLKDRCRRYLRMEQYLPDLAEAVGTWPEFQDAQILELHCPPHAHREQLLPEGSTCDECAHFGRCVEMRLTVAGQGYCDFLPSRWRESQ